MPTARFGRAIIFALFAFGSPFLFAQSVTLAWDPNPAPDIAGYRLYCGTSTGVYNQRIDVGNVTSASVSALQIGTRYFFAVTAYNNGGKESPRSNEISYTVTAATPTPAPTATPKPSATPTATASPTNGAAVMTQPVPGSKFSGSTVTFQWTPGSATQYALALGSTAQLVDISSSGPITSLSITVNYIPTDGRNVFATLYSKLNNSWTTNVYAYHAAGGATSPTPTPKPSPTPTPTPTPKPTPTPTPTPTPKPSPTPTPKPSPTPTPTPTSTPTSSILVGTVSRMAHGSAGSFDVPLPLSGAQGVECRSGATPGSYQIVATFTGTVMVNSVSITAGTGTVSSISAAGSQLTINLTQLRNGYGVTVTLSGVRTISDPTLRNFSIPMGVLVGDTTGDGVVDSSDASQAQAQIGHTVTTSNFRNDMNLSGGVSSTDVTMIQSNAGMVLH